MHKSCNYRFLCGLFFFSLAVFGQVLGQSDNEYLGAIAGNTGTSTSYLYAIKDLMLTEVKPKLDKLASDTEGIKTNTTDIRSNTGEMVTSLRSLDSQFSRWLNGTAGDPSSWLGGVWKIADPIEALDLRMYYFTNDGAYTMRDIVTPLQVLGSKDSVWNAMQAMQDIGIDKPDFHDADDAIDKVVNDTNDFMDNKAQNKVNQLGQAFDNAETQGVAKVANSTAAVGNGLTSVASNMIGQASTVSNVVTSPFARFLNILNPPSTGTIGTLDFYVTQLNLDSVFDNALSSFGGPNAFRWFITGMVLLGFFIHFAKRVRSALNLH